MTEMADCKGIPFFVGHYVEWRAKRISKLVSIFGEDFFNGKDILELGCGLGEIGERFIEFGSTVTFCDVRPEYLLEVKKRIPNSTTHLIDQNTEWNLNKRFDFIIHTGVLYHLTEWKQDLLCALNHSDLIFLEAEVPKGSISDDYEEVMHENGYDQAISGVSKRPSAARIEKFLTEQGVKFKRYDDADINTPVHKYDWVTPDPENKNFNYRRFWIISK